MAGPGDETPGAGDRSHLRASHADREQVIDVIKAAFVQGRLAKDEFDQRIGRVFASRTYADLAAVTASIPAGLTGAQLPQPAQKPADKDAVAVVTCVSAAWTSIWVPLVIMDGIHSVANLVLVVIIICVVPVLLAGFLVYHAWLDKRAAGWLNAGSQTGAY